MPGHFLSPQFMEGEGKVEIAQMKEKKRKEETAGNVRRSLPVEFGPSLDA